MAYWIELTERANLPAGREWMLLEETSGDVRLVIAEDARPFVLSEDSVVRITEALVRANYLSPEMVRAS